MTRLPDYQIYLVPLGSGRFELYSEPPDDHLTSAPDGPPQGFVRQRLHRLHERWREAVHTARHRKPASRMGRARDWAVSRVAESIAEQRTVALPKSLARGGRTYVLQVKGDSMTGEQILDGDYVVVEERATPRNGEVVVALVDGREATLKTYRRDRGRVRLIPAHPSMKPIVVRPESLRVQGIVSGVLRRYA